MTILTKQGPSAVDKTVLKTSDAATIENGAIVEQDENGNNDKLFLLRERTRRFTGSTLLLILATFCLACMGILIGLLIYRRIQFQRLHFHGFHDFPYDRNFEENQDELNAMNQMSDGSFADRYFGFPDNIFRQELDLDLTDENSHAKISVPDFRDGRVGRFLHDFKKNQTAIIDGNAKRCFVMPLDRDNILPPKDFLDLIIKMTKGYYDINTTSVRKNMHVIEPALTDLSSISKNIQDECDSMEIYRLQKYIGGIVKRSAHSTNGKKFSEFSGNYIHYNIVNMDQLNRK